MLQKAPFSTPDYGILRNFSNHVHFHAKPHTDHTDCCKSIPFSSGRELPRKKVQTLYTCLNINMQQIPRKYSQELRQLLDYIANNDVRAIIELRRALVS